MRKANRDNTNLTEITANIPENIAAVKSDGEKRRHDKLIKTEKDGQKQILTVLKKTGYTPKEVPKQEILKALAMLDTDIANLIKHGTTDSTAPTSAPINHRGETKVKRINADGDKEIVIPAGFADIDDMEQITTGDLLALKNDALKGYCVALGVTKTGNKKQLVHNVMEGLSTFLDKITHIDKSVNLTDTDKVMNYIYSNHIEEILAYKMVVKMATKGLPIYDDKTGKITGFRPYRCAEGCRLLMYDNTDPLWGDARQEVGLTLWEHKEDITIVNGFCHFPDGKIWKACERSISHMFSKQRLNSDQIQTTYFGLSANPETGETIIEGLTPAQETRYIKNITAECGTLDDIATSDFIRNFFLWCKASKKYGKHTETMQLVFCGRIQGLTKAESMKRYNITKQRYDDNVTRLKSAYADYKEATGYSLVGENIASRTDGVTYRKSEGGASGSYTFKYGIDTRAVISKSYPLPCGILPEAEKEASKTADKKAEAEHIHVYVAKNGRVYKFKDGQPIAV